MLGDSVWSVPDIVGKAVKRRFNSFVVLANRLQVSAGTVVVRIHKQRHPYYKADLAQLVERLICNQVVGGSNPSIGMCSHSALVPKSDCESDRWGFNSPRTPIKKFKKVLALLTNVWYNGYIVKGTI